MQARRHPRIAKNLDRFDVVYAEGMGAVLTLLATRGSRCKKVTAGDFFLDLCREASRRGLPVALVGARLDVMRRAVERIRQEVPDLHVDLALIPSFSRKPG